jgi:predicted RNA-binding Zn-ribbon protein involved in translation (DUF1610 family)
MHDQPWYCPRCGVRLEDRSFIGEYWIASATNLAIWCVSCGWEGLVVEEGAVTTFEPAQEAAP